MKDNLAIFCFEPFFAQFIFKLTDLEIINIPGSAFPGFNFCIGVAFKSRGPDKLDLIACQKGIYNLGAGITIYQDWLVLAAPLKKTSSYGFIFIDTGE